MYRFFISSVDVSEDRLTIRGNDVHHIRQVLRMRPGEGLEAVDEDRTLYHLSLEAYEEDTAVCRINSRELSSTELSSRITLYMGLPKGDKMELVIQKAVELGATEIVPVACERSVVKLDAKKADARVERWNRIAEGAASQSKRTVIPRVLPVVTFAEAVKQAGTLDHIFIMYEQERGIEKTREAIRAVKNGQTIGVFIGPEGGFDPREISLANDAGAKVLTLGRRILRTETAAITALSVLMFELEE